MHLALLTLAKFSIRTKTGFAWTFIRTDDVLTYGVVTTNWNGGTTLINVCRKIETENYTNVILVCNLIEKDGIG